MIQNDLQTIILAAGKGSRMTQLLFGKPKCLLPIANKPMIQYTLELLIRSNIKETIILVLDNEEELIKSSIHKLGLEIVITYVTITSHNDTATADSLRAIKDQIMKDVLILTCDVVTDHNLNEFFQLYRLNNSTFQCFLSAINSEKENQIPARKLNYTKEFDIIGLDVNIPNRLVLHEPDVMFCDNVPLKRSFMKKCSNFKMYTNLTDVHIYIFKNWTLNYLEHKESIKSIKADFVPSIIRKQFRHQQKPDDNSGVKQRETEKHMFDFVQNSEMTTILTRLQSGDLHCDPKPGQYPESLIKCFAYQADSGYCIRVNNWVQFCEANRVIMNKLRSTGMNHVRSEMIKSNIDGLIGTATSVGEKCAIKRTVIGSNCKIGDKVKLTNCILLDNVTIGEESIIQGSVICYDVAIGNNVQIKECIIGPRKKIAAFGSFTNESLTEEMLDHKSGKHIIMVDTNK